MKHSKKILLPFARSALTLEIARKLHAGSHKIIMTDTMRFPVSRLSNTVSKYIQVPSPRFDPEGYLEATIKIVEDNKIDLIIPVWEEVAHLSRHKDKFPSWCSIFSPSFENYHDLHNKWRFQNLLSDIKLPTPKTVLIRDISDLKKAGFQTPYAFKACYSRASQKVLKIQPNELPDIKIEPHNPWIAQEWIDGKRYCTYSICYQGKVKAHAVYPVNYAIGGNSCITFDSIHHPGILDWVKKVAAHLNYTGQFAFDLIETKDGTIYAIECNPRATSGVHLFGKNQGLDQAFFGQNEETILAPQGSRRQIAVGMCLFGWRKSSRNGKNVATYLRDLMTYRDVLFDERDVKPFVFNPFILGCYWIDSLKYKMSLPAYFTYDYDWDGDISQR